MEVNKDFSYKEVTLLNYKEFKQRCDFFFECYFGKEKFNFFVNEQYYCGEGCLYCNIYRNDDIFKQILIEQHDYYKETCYKLYSGFGKDEKHISDFISLTSVFNYIIANDLLI